MADCSAATIEIGGPVPLALKEELLESLADEDLSIAEFDGHERSSDPDLVEAYLAACAGRRQPACFAESMASGGRFLGLERFLVKHLIPYRRFDDGHYTWAPALRVFEPAAGYDDEVISDQEGRAFASADLLRFWRREDGLDLNGCIQRLRAYETCPPFSWGADDGLTAADSTESHQAA